MASQAHHNSRRKYKEGRGYRYQYNDNPYIYAQRGITHVKNKKKAEIIGPILGWRGAPNLFVLAPHF